MYKNYIKRIIDIFFSLIILIILSPLYLLISFFIIITMGFPVFYRGVRVKKSSKNINTFIQYKFRTMVRDAEEIYKKELWKKNIDKGGHLIIIPNDPRITPFGKFLRRFSIDELPQFWNILKGDMTLIGPRPAAVDEVKRYSKRAYKRLSVKPGLTGLWQIKGRKAIGFEKMIELDLKYIEDITFKNDIKIFFLTIPAIIFGIGSD